MLSDIIPVHAGFFCVLQPPCSFFQIYLLLQLPQRQSVIKPCFVYRIVQLLPLSTGFHFQKSGKCPGLIQLIAQLCIHPDPLGLISQQGGILLKTRQISGLMRQESACKIVPEVSLHTAAFLFKQSEQVLCLLKLSRVKQSLHDIVDMALPFLLPACGQKHGTVVRQEMIRVTVPGQECAQLS